MRLVIGRDLAHGNFVLRPLSAKDAPKLAAAAPGKSG
jgi:hypothetical protein